MFNVIVVLCSNTFSEQSFILFEYFTLRYNLSLGFFFHYGNAGSFMALLSKIVNLVGLGLKTRHKD